MRTQLKVLRNALTVSDRDLARLKGVAKRGRAVFNPDKKRVQSALRSTDPIVRQLRTILTGLKLLDVRRMTSPVVLHSNPECKQQQWHYDYDPTEVRAASVKPLGVLVALQDGTRFETRGKTHRLSRGDVLLFRGDLLHAGAAYESENTRVHTYLDVPGVKRPKNRTWFAVD